MNDKNVLGAPKIIVPAIAYRQLPVYQDGINVAPRMDDYTYRQYVFLGRLLIANYADSGAARDAARTKFGPRARVFRTARFWVCYQVD